MLGQGFDTSSYKGMDIIHLPSEEPFLQFRTTVTDVFNGRTFWLIEDWEILKGNFFWPNFCLDWKF